MRRDGKTLILVAMIFAVAMIFIDQTIVALAIPKLQSEIHLSPTGAQWIVNGYLLSLSALFALGGRVADVVGHRRVVLIGVSTFALFSALCGATPTSSIGETWIIVFRILQGASAAFLFPAALAIVVGAFPVNERGRAMAIFFSISGGLTSVGPIAGGYLTQWTWRSIFWINVPVAIIAIVLTLRTDAGSERRPGPIDTRGAVLICISMGLAVLGLQQASTWGWQSPATWACLVAGLALLGVFVRQQLHTADPLVPMRLFADRGFAVDNAVLFLLSVCFVPLFFFASVYAQGALGESASNAGLFLLVFFGGFTAGAQWGGRVLDSRGARPTVVIGCAVAAVGFYLWGHKLSALSFSSQWYWLALAGVGMGMVLGPVSTDAINRASSATYGAVTGVTQTVRNFGGSLGLAILGSILITENVSRVKNTLSGEGVPTGKAEGIAHALSGSGGASGSLSGGGGSALHAVQLDLALSTRTVVYGMAGAMAVAFLLAVRLMPRGKSTAAVGEDESPVPVSPAGAAATG
jgi:EmrB/QacA subfamily drug resistance transporter